MTIRTRLTAGRVGWTANHNEALKVRTALKAGGVNLNHNGALQVRSAIRAGKLTVNHNETSRREAEPQAMTIRTQLRAGANGKGQNLNHSETLTVRTTLRAGGSTLQHNEALRRESDRPAISMRKQVRATASKPERLELLVVRAGLRAGRVVRERNRRRW